MDILAWPKAHPWTTGAILVGGGLAIMLVTRGGGGTTIVAGSSGTPGVDNTSAELAAQVQAQAISAQAGVQSQAIAADLQKTSIGADVAAGIAALQAQLGMAQVDASKDVSLANISASLAALLDTNQSNVGIAALQANVANNQINTAGTVQNNQINTSADITKAIIDAFKPAAPVVTNTDNNLPVNTTTTVVKYANQWDEYIADNPDLASNNWFGEHANLSPDQAAALHYQEYGQSEGRVLDTSGVGTVTPTTVAPV